MMPINLFKLRPLFFKANLFKKLVFFCAMLLFGFQGYGQTVTITANQNPQEGQISASDSFTVNVSAVLFGSVTVRYEVSGTSTATEGDDFSTSGEITIPLSIFGSSAQIQIDVTDDFIIEGDETIVIELLEDSSYTLESPTTATVTIQDNDEAGFMLSTPTLDTDENGLGQDFTVVLTAQPSSNVVLSVVSGNESEGTVLPTTLLFTPADWNMPQAVTVTPLDDAIADGPQTYSVTVSVDAAGSDPDFGTVTDQTVDVTNNDDETAGFALSTTMLTTIENGPTQSFDVTLNVEPLSDVVLNVVSANELEGIVSPTTLTFTPVNWNAPQPVTVTPVDDGIVDGQQDYIITVGVDAASSDPNFGSVPEQEVNVTNNDDDSAGFTLSPTSLVTTENGSDENFTVVLTSSPLSNVVFNVVSDNELEGIVSPATLTFTPANWNAPQPVAVTPVGDGIVDGSQTYTVRVSIDPANSDDNFDFLTAQQINVTNNDNDTYTATITATTPNASEDPVVLGVFTVELDAINTTGSPIVVNYTVGGGTATSGSDFVALSGSVSIPNNQQNATITLTPLNDSEVEADETVILTLATGTGYTVGTPTAATVNIISEDSANISIDDVTVDENAGMATFTVTLSGDTPTDFEVSYSTSNGTATAGLFNDYRANSGSLDFDGSDGESYTIEIVIRDDGQPENNETFFVNLSVSNGFVSLSDGQGMGTIIDNDNCVAEPIRNPNVPTTFCEDDFSQDLNEYVTAGDIPNGYVLIWSNSNDFTDMGARRTNTVVTRAATYYGFLYDEETDCSSRPLAVTLSQNDPPSILRTSPATICGPGEATISAVGSASGGTLSWYDSESATVPLRQGSSFFIPEITVTTTYYVEILANGCTSEREPVTVTVADPINIGTVENASACHEAGEDNTSIDLDSTRAGVDLATGVWSIVGTPPGTITIGADNIVNFEGAPEGDYVFRFTTNTATAPCVDESVDVTIAVVSCAMDSDADGLMDRDEIALGLDPNNPDTDGDGIDDATEVGPDINNPLDSGGFGIIDALNPCFPNISDNCRTDLGLEKTVDKTNALEGDQVVFTITLTNLGPIMVTNIRVNEFIDPNIGFLYVSHSVSKGIYDVAGGVWELDEVLGDEVNTLTITASVVREGTFQNVVTLVDSFPEDENPANNTARVSVIVGPRSNDECGFMFNQISPNGDGTNDTLYINCIEQYPDNSIQIYDRYGNEVYTARSYDNSWMGTGKNGTLPKGTYFYILDLGDGTEVRKGWIQIIRQ